MPFSFLCDCPRESNRSASLDITSLLYNIHTSHITTPDKTSKILILTIAASPAKRIGTGRSPPVGVARVELAVKDSTAPPTDAQSRSLLAAMSAERVKRAAKSGPTRFSTGMGQITLELRFVTCRFVAFAYNGQIKGSFADACQICGHATVGRRRSLHWTDLLGAKLVMFSTRGSEAHPTEWKRRVGKRRICCCGSNSR